VSQGVAIDFLLGAGCHDRTLGAAGGVEKRMRGADGRSRLSDGGTGESLGQKPRISAGKR